MYEKQLRAFSRELEVSHPRCRSTIMRVRHVSYDGFDITPHARP
jgi:hypothetical protein